MDTEIFKQEINQYVRRKSTLQTNMQKAYSLVLGQCTELMKSKLKGDPDWDIIKTDLDVLKLLVEIKTISFRFEDQKYQVLEIHNSKSNFYSFRQNDYPNSTYLTKFRNLADIASSLGGHLQDEAILVMAVKLLHPTLTDPRDSSLSPTEVEEVKETAEELYLSLSLIQHADRKRYSRGR